MESRTSYSVDRNGAEPSASRIAEAEGEDNTADSPESPPKMRFIHQRRFLNKGAIVQLDCDTQCNFMLLSDAGYAAYQQVRRFKYYGGTFKHFPARITVPETGDWNIVIDLAGAKSEIQYNITIVIE